MQKLYRKLRTIDDVKDFFVSLSGTFVGIGITAYSRIIPSFLLHPYYIVTLRKTLDLPMLRKKADIFCLEEELGEPVWENGFNAARLVAHPLIKKFLINLHGPKYLLPYQSYPELETMARNEGWFRLANPAAIRNRVNGRRFFLEMTKELRLNNIPYNISPIDSLYSRDYDYWAKKTGPKFVAQLSEIGQGGGRGTFFIKNKVDYQRLQHRLRGGTWRGIKLISFTIRKHMQGTSASLALCLTRHGILFSDLQRQLIDLPYCADVPEDGIFCGHSWGNTPWSSHIKDEAIQQARRIGEYLFGLGYKGILGIDLLIDEEKNRVYPLECNPRLVGALPMLSQLHLQSHTIPMEVFHILEFLNLPYHIDIQEINSQYNEPIKGSHVILFALSGRRSSTKQGMKAGLYECDPDGERLSYVKEAMDYEEIRNERQFIIIDGPPDTSVKDFGSQDPLYRLCRILFSYPVVDNVGNFSRNAMQVIERVYDKIMGKNWRHD